MDAVQVADLRPLVPRSTSRPDGQNYGLVLGAQGFDADATRASQLVMNVVPSARICADR